MMSWAMLLSIARADDVVVTPEAQFRPRFEADSGRDFVGGAGDVAFVTHRARLGAVLASGAVEARIVFQDVRAWGEEADTRRDFSGDGIDLGIGTVTWRPADHIAVIVGRQEVSLHAERLVARANWRQPGRRFDGGRLQFADDTWAAEIAGFVARDSDVFLFTTQDQVEPGVAGDQTLWFARAGREADDLTLQAVAVVDSRQEVVDAEIFRVTPGVFFEARGDQFHGLVEGYGQFGRLAGGDQQARAAMLGTSATWSPEGSVKPTVGISYDVLSGDGQPDDDVATAFDPLRGANHRYYGHQDIAVFFRGGPSTGQGLHDPHLSVSVRPTAGWTVTLEQHLFVAAAGEELLALEPDLNLKGRLHDGLLLTAGASVWAEPGEPDRPVETFGYLMLDAVLRGPTLGGS